MGFLGDECINHIYEKEAEGNCYSKKPRIHDTMLLIGILKKKERKGVMNIRMEEYLEKGRFSPRSTLQWRKQS